MSEKESELKAEAARLVEQLESGDLSAKESMAFMLIGMKLEQYGIQRLAAHVADKTTSEELRQATVERAFLHMREMATKGGFQSEVLVGNMRELEKILSKDHQREQEYAAQRRTAELALGIPTPFDALNKTLEGGIKAGKVLLVHGEAAAVFTTVAGMYRHFIKLKVPITHFGTGQQKAMPEVPGVKNIPGVFWRGQGSTLNKMKDAFAAGEGYVFILDRLDWLIDSDDRHKTGIKRRQLALKYLTKMAKRYKVGIVVGHVTHTDDAPSVGGVVRLPVCSRLLDGKNVFAAGDEIFEEHADGLRFPGRNNSTSSGLGESDGGTEGPEQLEGSGEDRSQEAGVAGDS